MVAMAIFENVFDQSHIMISFKFTLCFLIKIYVTII